MASAAVALPVALHLAANGSTSARPDKKKWKKKKKQHNISGKKTEAQALVPNEFIDAVALVGSHGRIVERLAPWKAAGKRGEVGSMLLSVTSPAILELFAREML